MNNQMPAPKPIQESENKVELQAPVHEQKPVIETPDTVNSSVAKVSVPSKGIKVVATRKGFYNQTRMKEGEEFTIKSEEEFGEWFKCVDPKFEEKRQAFYKSKKVKK